jgi:hypothetical protein
MVKSRVRQTTVKSVVAESVAGPGPAEALETVKRLVKTLKDSGATVEIVVVGRGAAPEKKIAGETTFEPMKVGAYTKKLINEGLDNATIVKALRKRFPDAANTPGNINWYRRKLKDSS